MPKGVNHAVRAAEKFLRSIEGKALEDLTDLQYLARIGAKAVKAKQATMVKWRAENVEHQRAEAKRWGEENPERKKLGNRINSLRGAIRRLHGKPASNTVDWPARVVAYEAELKELLDGAGDAGVRDTGR